MKKVNVKAAIKELDNLNISESKKTILLTTLNCTMT